MEEQKVGKKPWITEVQSRIDILERGKFDDITLPSQNDIEKSFLKKHKGGGKKGKTRRHKNKKTKRKTRKKTRRKK